MLHRATPLTRNQLLELEALVRGLVTVVSQKQHRRASSTPASVGDQSSPSSIPSTPTSLTANVVKPSSAFSSRCAGGVAVFAGLLSSPNVIADAKNFEGPSTRASHDTSAQLPRLIDHPVLHGTFMDVFTDPLTATAWRLYDKILYTVWWSYRPPSCTNCGMHDAWMPSGDVEFKCAFCLSGAGTTRSNAIVEDVGAAANEDAEYGNDSGEDDEVDEKDKTGGGGEGNGGTGGLSGGPISTYLFFYEWLQRIPLLGPAGAAAAHRSNGVEVGGHGTGNGQRLSAANTMNVAPPSSLGSTRRGGERRSAAGPSNNANNSAATSNSSSSVMLPSGESLPAVLRAAYDISCLLTAPGLPRGTTPVICAAGLYMSLLLHRYVSLFPLFCMAGRMSSIDTEKAAAGASEASDSQVVEVELQWIDVELVSALLGVAAPSFFESVEVSVQHLQNVFTVAAAYGVPSVLWHPGRVPGRVEMMKALKEKVIPLCPLHSTTAGVSGLCPEHTAMIVALEFARRVDAHPVAASSTSPAAAAQNAQRIGMWLDALGLYPTRRVYRDIHSFHHVVTQEQTETERKEEARGEVRGNNTNSNVDGGGTPKDDNDVASQSAKKEEDEEERKVDIHGIMHAWEKTLTELAAVNDTHLTAAAERHAHRHDSLATVTKLDLGTNKDASSAPLTTPRSPFHKHFEWILTSPCANALLHVFAAVFRLTPMELADMALRSGIYQGHASGFVTTLRTAVQRGAFDVMPLARRLSPVTSSWMSAYMALHSGDRLPLLAALFQFNDGQNSTRDRQAALTRLLQRILRKHHASQVYQLNYVLRVTDEDEKHFNGIYFLSSVLWREGLAVFTCLRSGRKTITLNRFAHTFSLCYMNAKEKIVPRLKMHVVSPVVAAVETEAARLVMEVALGAVARGISTHGDPWRAVVRCLDKCARVRRRMRVPMLASRLDALTSIRENTSTVVRHFQQFPSLYGVACGGGGANGGSTTSMMTMGPTLLGWGETETLLSAAPQLDVRQLRRDLQWNFLALPNVSLLLGLSENRVVAMYASLVGILELIHDRLSASQTAAAATTSSTALSNWVEELLFVEDDEDEGGAAVAHDVAVDFNDPLYVSDRRSGPGWSPPMYRNSRGNTPKLSRSPKSKFIAVSTATNTSRYAPTPPQGFARQPYTVTPPSMVPSRSPVLRSATASTASTLPSFSSTRGPQGNTKGSNSKDNNTSASVSAFAPSQYPVSTTISCFQRSPPLAMRGNNNADTWHGGDVFPSAKLPDLALSASTADVEKRLSSGFKAGQQQQQQQQQRASRRAGRRRVRDDSDGDAQNDHNNRNDEDQDGSDSEKGTEKKTCQQEQKEEVLRLLRQMLPPYWAVLLGLVTDLTLPNTTAAGRASASTILVTSASSTRAGVRGEFVDDEDEGENGGEEMRLEGDDARHMSAHARERRLRRQQHQQQHGDLKTRPSAVNSRLNEKDNSATPTATMSSSSRSEAFVTHRPFNVFDAVECRRRLHRLYVFIGAYIECKERCQALAAAGTLPTITEKSTSPPPPFVTDTAGKPTTTTATATTATRGSPPALIRGTGRGKTAATGSSNKQRSPCMQHLTPPPAYNPLVGPTPQRSPPHPPVPRADRPHTSPPYSPETRNNSVIQRPSWQSGGTSPVPLSPSPTESSRNSGVDGKAGGGGSPLQRSSVAPPMRSSPLQQQQSKRVSGTMKSNTSPHGQRAKGSHDRAAVALVDDANFSLPPSEVTWADNQQQQQQRQTNRKEKEDRLSSPSSLSYAVSPQDGRRSRHPPPRQRRQQQRQASRSSTTSSETEIEEETASGTVFSQQASSSHKRVRDESYSSSTTDKRECRSEEHDAQKEAEEAPLQQLLRRKTKKLGRRRRRQEQSALCPPPSQTFSKAPLPSRGSSISSNCDGGGGAMTSKEPSHSPEIRAWRSGKTSGSVSPLDNSPVLPPRPSNADLSAKPKPRTTTLGSPSQNTAVPSIRGRAAGVSEEAAASSTTSDSEQNSD